MSHTELVLWAGAVIGLLFGACGQITGFCLHRGLKEYWSGAEGYKLESFAMALAVALASTQLLDAMGIVDLSQSLYRMPSYSWLLVPLGGAIFGFGMVLANGCGARALVLLGQGNLRSLVVLLCLGIAAYITLTGVLAPARVAFGDLTTVSPDMLTLESGWPRAAVTIGAVALLLVFALSKHAAGPRITDLVGGAFIGLLVASGWFVTGWLGNDDFEPVPLASLTFVAPIGDTIQYAMIATGMSPRFGVMVVAGVVIGALLTALVRGRTNLEGFESPRQMVRYIIGGAMMGAGGALAFGCSIGQGLTGLSTLSFSSVLAAVGIVVGARCAWAIGPAPLPAADTA